MIRSSRFVCPGIDTFVFQKKDTDLNGTNNLIRREITFFQCHRHIRKVPKCFFVRLADRKRVSCTFFTSSPSMHGIHPTAPLSLQVRYHPCQNKYIHHLTRYNRVRFSLVKSPSQSTDSSSSHLPLPLPEAARD